MSTSHRLLVIALLAGYVVLTGGCGDDDHPAQVSPGPPVVSIVGTTGASTGVDVRVDFSVSDPDQDPIAGVFATGVWDSVGFDPVSGHGRLYWRACKAGPYSTTIHAIAGGDTSSASVGLDVVGVADHYVDMIGGALHFQPETLYVTQGETVAWRNLDTAAHNVYLTVDGTGIDRVNPGCESKALILSASQGAPSPGMHPYFCILDTLRRDSACYIIVSP